MPSARPTVACLVCGVLLNLLALPLLAAQPKVAPGPGEPNWWDLLRERWDLDMERDLHNPLRDGTANGVFERVDKGKPVTFTPVLALGLTTATRGGWYPAAGEVPAENAGAGRLELWTYAYKHPAEEMTSGKFTLPPLSAGGTAFEPEGPFGLWIGNDDFDDGGVFTQPERVARVNQRLKAQPYKAMIYPLRDREGKQMVANSYLIGWEYSTNDDFQDVVTRVDNVRLLPADPSLGGILPRGSKMEKLAGGFAFTEGPTWDRQRNCLYFSDIPPAHIVRYQDGKPEVINGESGGSNGLMMDKDGSLIACEHQGRRVSRTAEPGRPAETIVDRYQGKRLNSPNDLWLDEAGGIYFTDPRYGSREDLEQDKEAVYYIAADKTITRIIDSLVRPNGIALSPDGKTLYVVDNGAAELHAWKIESPGKLGAGRRIACVAHPDGMTVDSSGRLYVTGTGGVWVLDGDGGWIGLIPTPEHPANATFGGSGGKMLFITARLSLYGIVTTAKGWHVHLDGVPK